MKRWLVRLAVVVPLVLVILLGGGLWLASGQLLFPAFRGASKDLSVCTPELERAFGKHCGNLRVSGTLTFREVNVPALSGVSLPAWLIGSAENGKGPAQGAVLLVHGGGSDRREMTRHASFYLARQLDVLTLDLGCHGEAPCPVPGMTYGERESRDVVSAYLYLTKRYERVLAMGSSVGAAALLVALPEMPALRAAVVENPLVSFQRLITEFPATRSFPDAFTQAVIRLTLLRGHFHGRSSPEHALPLASGTRLFFIHSQSDNVVSYRHSEELAAVYRGPKSTWFPERGDHSALREGYPLEYERRLTAFLDAG